MPKSLFDKLKGKGQDEKPGLFIIEGGVLSVAFDKERVEAEEDGVFTLTPDQAKKLREAGLKLVGIPRRPSDDDDEDKDKDKDKNKGGGG